MFREMRRLGQQLTTDETIGILTRATSGTLAVVGDEGYPYAVPLSFVYSNGRLYFHCALTGHKVDALANSDKVSFCVIDQDAVKPEEFTTYYRSVIVFGRARVMTDDSQKRKALTRLAQKYSPDERDETSKRVTQPLDKLCMIELTIEHMTGKQSALLVQK